MKVTIYSTTSCATCHLVTGWLDKQNVKYEKHDTDVDQKAMEEFMSVNDGMLSVPFTVIETDDGKMQKMTGFNANEFKAALGI